MKRGAKAARVRELFALGRSAVEIAAETGFDRRTIWYALNSKRSTTLGRPRCAPRCEHCGQAIRDGVNQPE